MARRKPIQREPSPRDCMGLSAAENGDPDGVARFLAWAKTETVNIALFGSQPECISRRLLALGHEMKELNEFASGYAEALKTKGQTK